MGIEQREGESLRAYKLRVAYVHAMRAKTEIFKAQDSANYVVGLEEIEEALRGLRADLEAFDRLCRKVKNRLLEDVDDGS